MDKKMAVGNSCYITHYTPVIESDKRDGGKHNTFQIAKTAKTQQLADTSF